MTPRGPCDQIILQPKIAINFNEMTYYSKFKLLDSHKHGLEFFDRLSKRLYRLTTLIQNLIRTPLILISFDYKGKFSFTLKFHACLTMRTDYTLNNISSFLTFSSFIRLITWTQKPKIHAIILTLNNLH